MIINLIERDHELATLHSLLDQLSAHQGRIVLISGEAGIGKTALVDQFLVQARNGRQSPIRILWGACEALFTPRPLGPLVDIAPHMRPTVRVLLDSDARRPALFATVLDDLTHSPTVLAIEDIHWADEATLDLITYLAHRITHIPVLLLLTYRDVEIDTSHPLRFVLGELATRDVARLRLLPLSEAAVLGLALNATRSADGLYAATGGNPFFVTEVLADEASGVPISVSDAVLGRVARRSPGAQRLMELVAVAPSQLEQEIITDINPELASMLEECLGAGLLHLQDSALAFRHELARQAVEGALSPARRQMLHEQVLHALLAREIAPNSMARLVHHAALANDAVNVLRLAPIAARQASAQRAHREAMAHYQTALRYADRLDLETRAALLDEHSYESYLTEHMEEAVASCAAALTLWRALDCTEQIGHDLRLLATYHWVIGKHAEFKRFALEALAVLETAPDGRELAMAYAILANVYMNDIDGGAVRMWGKRAIGLAKRLHAPEPMVDALNSIGWSELRRGDKRGWSKLERSLKLAVESTLERNVARGYVNLATYLVQTHAYAQVASYLEDGMAYCAEHDLDIGLRNLLVERARARLDQGDWKGAEEDVTAILSVPWVSMANRIPALITLGRLQARRGDSKAEATLNQARDLAVATGDTQYIAPMAASRAEWRWLQGDYAGCALEAEAGIQSTPYLRIPQYEGELAVWLWRSGASRHVATEVPSPYDLEVAGNWQSAAQIWERFGCPYEQALALLDGHVESLRAALEVFTQLGAAPAVEITRRRLREHGVRAVLQGPRRATRANPQGLTNRELEVLPLIAEGLSNSKIAERLSASPKTIEHHVSAVLAKLQARSRAEAVRRASELGLLPELSRTH